MDKILYIFIWDNLSTIGGVENYISNSIKYLSKQDFKIGLMKKKHGIVSADYSSIVDNYVDIIINGNNINLLKKFININRIFSIKIISFQFYDFVRAEIIKNKLSNCVIDTFYFVPHFKNHFYYPQEFFNNQKSYIKMQKKMRDMSYKMILNNNLYFFDFQHELKYQKEYGINVVNRKDLLVPLPQIDNTFTFNKKIILEKYSRQEFNILLISRLDFPHKGFMLGGVRTFIKLKELYPQLTLTIIGDGRDKDVLLKVINEAPYNTKKDIHYLGALPQSAIYSHYDYCNLLISLAGSILLGAERGVLSLVARHYCNECQVYGFLPDCPDKILCQLPGQDVEIYINKVLKMSNIEILEKCEETYNYCKQNIRNESTFVNIRNNSNDISLSKKNIRYMLVFFFIMNKLHFWYFFKYGLINGLKNCFKRFKDIIS